jgi:hypothetical protein
MTKEQRELLLKDLCGRLPYGVKVQDEIGRINKLVIGNADLVRLYYNDFSIYSEKQLSLPCLFPLSSMTEEQKTSHNFLKHSAYASPAKLIDFYNKNHLDYRGLIPMNLAIDATNLNIY